MHGFVTRGSEAQQGAQYHPQFLAEFGGAMSGPHATYVEQVGKYIAVQSGLGNARESFTVSLLNSSVHNAFAVPGGYIYTTRQLVALMNRGGINGGAGRRSFFLAASLTGSYARQSPVTSSLMM